MIIVLLYCMKIMPDGLQRSEIRALSSLLTTTHRIFLYGAQARRRSICHTVPVVLHLCARSLDSLLCRLCPHPHSDPAFDWAQLAQQETIRRRSGNTFFPHTSRVKYVPLAFQTREKTFKLKIKPHSDSSPHLRTREGVIWLKRQGVIQDEGKSSEETQFVWLGLHRF